MSELKLTVNGVEHTLDVPANRYLAQVLRYDLGLTGTKIGCNEAECGACTVIVNGKSVDSCIYPAFKAQGADVMTIEGVAENGEDGEWRVATGHSQLATRNLATPSLSKTPLSSTERPSAVSARRASSCRPRPCWT